MQVVAVQRETDARLTLVVQGLSRGVALRCTQVTLTLTLTLTLSRGVALRCTQVRVRGAAVRAC